MLQPTQEQIVLRLSVDHNTDMCDSSLQPKERTQEMLGDHPIEVVLLATDLKASREFYAEKIGLEVVRETDYAVWFKCGKEGRL